MKYGAIALLLCSIAFFCLGAGSKAKGFVITFHLEGDAEESAKFVTPIKLGSEHRQYYFRKMPSFTDSDITWFYPFVSQDGASYGAAFRLKDHKAEELKGITLSNQGKLFGTRVMDAPLRAVIIDRPISDGILVIWDGLSQNHVKLIGEKIPHIDRFRTGTEMPTFNVPENAPQAAPNPENGETAKPKRRFQFFGNSKKQDEPVNPYVNPPGN